MLHQVGVLTYTMMQGNIKLKCFGHLYAYHQGLETILILLPHMVCNALVVGGRLLRADQQDVCPG